MATTLLSSSTAKIPLFFCLSKAVFDALCCQASALLQAAPSSVSSVLLRARLSGTRNGCNGFEPHGNVTCWVPRKAGAAALL